MANWKETVLTPSQIGDARLKGFEWNNTPDKSMLEVQAELSFKAVYEKGFIDAEKIATDQAYEAGIDTGILRGMREVVEWVNTNTQASYSKSWQAQLKEWGKKEMCVADKHGVCHAAVCYSSEHCNARDKKGFPIYIDKPYEPCPSCQKIEEVKE